MRTIRLRSRTSKVARISSLIFLIAILSSTTLAGCSRGTNTLPTTAPDQVAAPNVLSTSSTASPHSAPPVRILPANAHVTGLPYPSVCTLRFAANGGWLPDRRCTPGAGTDAVTQANIRTTICTSRYTDTIRAPESETSKVKTTAMRSYNEPAADRPIIELDHVVPLTLGGSNHTTNLWPQPSDLPNKGYKNTKDSVERSLNAAVCANPPRATLAQARNAVAYDWTTALQVLHLK